MMWAFYGCSALTEIDGLDTPAKWNSVCREAIWRNYDLMRPHTQLLFHDYFMERYGVKN